MIRIKPAAKMWAFRVSVTDKSARRSGAWRANTNSCCAVIEGLGLPQGLTNTEIPGTGGCECILYACTILSNTFKKKRKREKIIRDFILKFFFSFTPRNTPKLV